jgi:hypothetical protein
LIIIRNVPKRGWGPPEVDVGGWATYAPYSDDPLTTIFTMNTELAVDHLSWIIKIGDDTGVQNAQSILFGTLYRIDIVGIPAGSFCYPKTRCDPGTCDVYNARFGPRWQRWGICHPEVV